MLNSKLFLLQITAIVADMIFKYKTKIVRLLTFFPQPNDKCWKISLNSLRLSIKIKILKMCFITQNERSTCMKIYIYLHICIKTILSIHSVSFCEVCTIWIVMFPNRICTRSQKFSNYAHTSGIIWMSLSWASKDVL